MIEWSKGLSIGVPEIDDEHKALIKLINSLSTAIDEEHEAHVIEECLDQLEDYIHQHFRDEEALMTSLNYDDISKHVQQHRKFTSRVEQFREELLKTGSKDTAEKLVGFLRNWLVTHIVTEDTKLAQLIKDEVAKKGTLKNTVQFLVKLFVEHIPFASRIFIIALLSSLILLVNLAVGLSDGYDKLQQLEQVKQLYAFTHKSGELIHHLQAERGMSIRMVASEDGLVDGRIKQLRSQSDSAQKELSHYMAALMTKREHPALILKGEQLHNRYNGILQLRKALDEQTTTSRELMNDYTNFIEELLVLADLMIQTPMNNKLNNAIFADTSIMHYKEKVGLERALGSKAIELGLFEQGDAVLFFSLLGQKQSSLTDFYRTSSTNQIGLWRGLESTSTFKKSEQLEKQLISAWQQGELNKLDSKLWWDSFTKKMHELQLLLVNLKQNKLIIVDNNREEQVQALYISSFYLLGLICLISLLSVLLYKSITQPIRKLTHALTLLSTGNRSIHLKDKLANDELKDISLAYELCRSSMLRGDYERYLLDKNKQKVEHYKELSTTDPLTGLNNRRAFYALSIAELERAVRYTHPISLLYLDIDHFKRVNDTFGHLCGDLVLQEFSDLCKSTARTSDVVARLGGEEFGILMPETNLDNAKQIADRLLRNIRGLLIKYEDEVIHVTASIGLVEWHPQNMNSLSDELDLLLNTADGALYKAKESGRDHFEVGSLNP